MSQASNVTIDRLLKALEDGSDDCWAIYEEIGRVVVSRLLRTDRATLRDVACAWIASDDAQATLIDTDRDSPDLGAAQARAEQADGAMRAVILNTVFGTKRA
ncbi:hypothetical protein [Burkholderia sp. BCC0322]|uniref:hypothetical protein n=1 Tax=unclassified Burkholderia TaxID=2613784 RepID=UPI001FC7CBD2|nr:hypothetical protein [Burkholderia sp. BCC0322]